MDKDTPKAAEPASSSWDEIVGPINIVDESRKDELIQRLKEQLGSTVSSDPIEGPSPAAEWDRDFARRALDELFNSAHQYKSSKAYHELLKFVGRFRFYSPFNAMLIHIQLPGATFVAPPHRWLHSYQRLIKPWAHPLIILRPMGPVMFVFDVKDTEAQEGAPPLPPEVEQPFAVTGGKIGSELDQTKENAKRDGINITEGDAGSQSAGAIRVARPSRHLKALAKLNPEPEFIQVPLRYELLLNSNHSPEAKYATLAHELAHLYCGHLGTPNNKWWPDRRGLTYAQREFEAESVCYLLCARLGIANPSHEYLSNFVAANEDTPSISLDCVMKAAGLIEQMGREHLKPRKEIDAIKKSMPSPFR